MSPYGAGRARRRRKRRPTQIKAEMMKGGYAIFKGPLKDNKGDVVIAAGKSLRPRRRPNWRSMNYLVEGVIGSIPG